MPLNLYDLSESYEKETHAVPAATIEVRRTYSQDQEIAIIDAVHAALVTAFRIPAEDKDVRLVVHAPHRFAVSPDLDHADCFTLVTIECFAGRSVSAKRNLYTQIVDRLAGLGIPEDHVTTILKEVELQNWGLRGGAAACDADLGFDINV